MRYREALVEFEAARRAFPRPEFDYNVGMCLAKLDRPAEAATALERFIAARPDDADADAVRAQILELRAAAASRPDPSATAPPAVTTPVVTAPPPPRFLSTGRGRAGVGLSVVSVGLLGAGAGFGGAALTLRDEYRSGCGRGVCDAALYSRGHGFAVATDVLLSVGGAALVTAVIVLARRPHAHARASVAMPWTRVRF
jgi:hypothetical protein